MVLPIALRSAYSAASEAFPPGSTWDVVLNPRGLPMRHKGGAPCRPAHGEAV